MSFTSTDLQNVNAAISALATGQREVRVTIGDKTFEYSETNLFQLKTLRAEIQAKINAAVGGTLFSPQRSRGYKCSIFRSWTNSAKRDRVAGHPVILRALGLGNSFLSSEPWTP